MLMKCVCRLAGADSAVNGWLNVPAGIMRLNTVASSAYPGRTGNLMLRSKIQETSFGPTKKNVATENAFSSSICNYCQVIKLAGTRLAWPAFT